MKQLLFFLLLISTTLHSQTRYPFGRKHKNIKTITLTNGKYDEFFDEDTLQRIGSFLININTKKITKIKLSQEEIDELENAQASRFLSVDPLTKSYPWYSPYQFAGNTPIMAIDLDGKEVEIKISNLPSGTATLRVISEKNIKDLPKEVVVQTYSLTVTDKLNNTTTTHQVTRDALFINQNEKPDKDGNFTVQNIPFEPKNSSNNTYQGEMRESFGTTELPAIRLRQDGSTSLAAEPVNSPFRKNQNVATDINIHVGGRFITSTTKEGFTRITGSEGCFTVVGGNAGITNLINDIKNRQEQLKANNLDNSVQIQVDKRENVPLEVKVPATSKKQPEQQKTNTNVQSPQN